MDTLQFIEPKTRSYYFETKDGRCFAPTYAWDAKYDIENGVYYRRSDENFNIVDFPTLHQLVKDGEVNEVNDEYTIRRDWSRSHKITELEIKEICDEFQMHGYNVTAKAIRHNFLAWADDFKSGFRGDDFFIFSPCGCNPFSCCASHLYEAEDFQKTYEV